jgi:small subunit ribosomal protein S13
MLSLKKSNKNKTETLFLKTFESTYGIGTIRLTKILKKSGINNKRSKIKKKLTLKIEKAFRTTVYSTVLRAQNKRYFNFFWSIRVYKGFRHKFKLPARGQRTKTNAKTKKKLKNYI